MQYLGNTLQPTLQTAYEENNTLYIIVTKLYNAQKIVH